MRKPLIVHDERLERISVPPPPPPDFDLGSLYVAPQPLQEKPKRFRDKAKDVAKAGVKRTLVSLFWHLFIGFLLNPLTIISVLGAICAGIAWIIGWKVDAPDEDKKKAESIINKVKTAAPVLAGAGGAVAVPAVIAQAEAKKGEIELQLLKMRDEHEKRQEAERTRKDAEKRDQLLARAALLKFEVDPSWSLARLEKEVEQAERKKRDEDEAARKKAEHDAAQAKYDEQLRQYHEQLRNGDNARCPYCRHPFRVSDAMKKKTLMCKFCLETFGGSRARAMWVAPPPPKPPKEGLIQRIFK